MGRSKQKTPQSNMKRQQQPSVQSSVSKQALTQAGESTRTSKRRRDRGTEHSKSKHGSTTTHKRPKSSTSSSSSTTTTTLVPSSPPVASSPSTRLHASSSLSPAHDLRDRGPVLIVGAGDFTYALCLVQNCLVKPSLLLCSSYDARSTLVRKYGPEVLRRLQQLRASGVTVRHGVDATRLSETLSGEPDDVLVTDTGTEESVASDNSSFRVGGFDVIIFNFPHTGTISVAANRHLLSSFFQSAKALLLPPPPLPDAATRSHIRVALKTTPKYCFWGIEKLAQAEGFAVPDALRFHPCPPGYQHRRTVEHGGQKRSVDGPDAVQLGLSAVWCFAPASKTPPPSPRLPRWLLQEQQAQKPVCLLCDRLFTTPKDLEKHQLGRKHRARELKEAKHERGTRKHRKKEMKEQRERRERTRREQGRDPALFCAVCMVFSNSLADSVNHVNGKRHREKCGADTDNT